MTGAIHDTPYDVLISYRRVDGVLAAYVERLARSLGLRVFRDIHEHVGGYDWRSFWRAALERAPDPVINPGIGPLVLVLATREIANLRAQDEVVREIEEALQNPLKTPVALLEFDKAAASALTDEITRRDPAAGRTLHEAHRVSLLDFPVAEPETCSPELLAALHNGVRRAAQPALRRRLYAARDRTVEWGRTLLANFLSPDCDLSQETGSTLADADVVPRAYVGAGGLGKSVRLARAVAAAVDAPQRSVVPVMIASEEAHLGVGLFSEALGFRAGDGEGLDAQVRWCAEKLQCRIVFVLDGLERSPQPGVAAGVLVEAAQAASLWLSCRPEVWSEVFAPALKWTPDSIVRAEPLDAAGAARLLRVKPEVVAARPFLAQPVFIDIAMRMLSEGELDAGALVRSSGLTETSLIAVLREWAVKDAPGDASRALRSACVGFLDDLATEQMRRTAFVASADAISALVSGQIDRDAIVARLVRERRYVVEHRFEGGVGFRLRHDLLDGAAIAERIAENPPARAQVLDRIESGFGQIVTGQLVQRCVDLGQRALIEEIFDRFLLLVDNKDFVGANGSWNPAGWGAGFVVQQKLPAFAACISDVLQADQPLKAEQEGQPVSRRVKPARITPGALSSVASMLRGAGEAGLRDPNGRLRRALVRHIRNPAVERKARLIEGLGRLRDARGDASSSVRDLGRLLKVLRNDPGAPGYIADALAHTRSRLALKVLDRLAGDLRKAVSADAAYAISLRSVVEHRNRLAARMAQPPQPLPPLEVGEVSGALRLRGERHTDVSDWVLWRDYADRVARSPEGRRLVERDPAIIECLARGRWHDHAQTRRDAMSALGDIDHDDAFFALLEASVVERLNVVEDAVFAGIRRHADFWRARGRGPEAAVLIAQAAARRAIVIGDRADAFMTALRHAGGAPAQIVTSGAIEIAPFIRPVLELHAYAPPEPAFAEVIAGVRDDPGPEWEEKHQLDVVSMHEGDVLKAVRRGARWADAARYHVGLGQRLLAPPVRARRTFVGDMAGADAHDAIVAAHVRATIDAQRCALEALGGRARAPAIVSVQAIVVSASGEVLLSQRASGSHYYPGAWSASFEEQVKTEDLTLDQPFVAAALRGMKEEFGPVDGVDISVLGQAVAFERETQGFFVLLALLAGTRTISRLGGASANADEIAGLRIAPLAALASGAPGSGAWHPTSEARWRFASRCLERRT